MASGINSTFRQVGIATGIAGLGAIFQHIVAQSLSRARTGACRAASAAACADFVSFGGARQLDNPALARLAEQAFVDGLNDILLYAGLSPSSARPRRRADAPAATSSPTRACAPAASPRAVIPLTPTALAEAAANLYDGTLGGGLADLRRMPSTVIDEGPQRTVRRYHRLEGTTRKRAPVLLVPPLAAPAICFDLRRGCSVAEHLPRPAARPTSSTTARSSTPTRARPRALDRGRGAEGDPRRVRGRRRPAGAGCRLVPGRHPRAAGAGPRPHAAGELGRADREPVRLRQGPARRPAAADRRDHAGLGITQLYRLLGGAGAAGQARLPGGRLRQVPDEAVDGALEPARPRAPGADRGGRRLHGPHARLPGAHVRPALSPLLPHQRPRRRQARARGRHDRPRRGEGSGAGDRRPRRRDRAGRGVPPRRGLLPPRGRRARHRARRPPRRADRPRGGRTTWTLLDGFLDKQQACSAAVRGAPGRGRTLLERRPTPHAPSRPLSALVLLLVLAAPAGARSRAADRTRHQGRQPRRRRPHRARGRRQAPAELQRLARPPDLGPGRRARATG